MRLSVKNTLLLFATIAIGGLLGVGAAGYYGQQRQASTLADMSVKLTALRNHLESDMMHDALRGDALAALYAAASGDHAGRAAIEADVADHAGTFAAKIEASLALDLPGDIRSALEDAAPALAEYAAAARRITAASFTELSLARTELPAFQQAFSALEEKMEYLSDLIERSAAAAEADAIATAEGSRAVMLATIVIAGLVLALIAATVMRAVGRPLAALHAAIEAIRRDDGSIERLSGFNAEFHAIEVAFNGVLEGIDARRAAEQQRAQAALRIQQALDRATTSLVLTDADARIIYLNGTAASMFERDAERIRRTIRDFDPHALIDGDLARLVGDAGLAGAIGSCGAARDDEIELGGNIYRVASTPVFDDGGQRVGVVCEWTALTEQREAERQIAAIISDAVGGQLDSRLDVTRLRGFTRHLAGGVNAMLDAIATPLAVASQALKSIAEGTIPPPIEQEFGGQFDAMRKDLNTCSEVLRTLTEDVRLLVVAAGAGRLDQRASIDRHWGDFRTIVAGMNDLLAAVAQPLQEVKTVIEGFAAGDLTRRMNGEYAGEFAILREAVDASMNNLAATITRINSAAGNISTSADEISQGNQDLNQRTQEQAAALEQTSSSLQTITERARDNAASSEHANALAQEARTEAEKGGRIVGEAVAAMDAINASSKRITDILSVIDGIAFQTNLLALNAAVEAARAGEQGRGFAVVASEVRNLAQNSAAAAREIKGLIGDSVRKVEHGASLVNASGETLREIVSSVNKVGGIVAEISDASGEQLRSFDEIMRAVGQLDEVTQQNAALVEQAAAASESMAEEARNLRAVVAGFDTGNTRPDSAEKPQPTLRPVASRKPSDTAVRRPAATTQPAATGTDNLWSEF
ncbi:MAG: methyl-accepting chemotaxis protein [Gammaproteobacteria bacterium]